jgi:multiple sugar transport system permease protein
MVLISFKSPMQWLNDRWSYSSPLRIQNYATEFGQVWRYLVNTLFVGCVGCAGMLVLASWSAFLFARMRFPGRDILFFLVIALMMVPGILSLVPQFMLYHDLGLLNSYGVLIVPYIMGGSVFGIFVLRTFFASLPEELFESARLDGCGVLGLYYRICLPLSLPILGTLAIISIVGAFNDFIWPLITIQNDNLQVIAVGLYHLQSTLTNMTTQDTSAAYGPLFAGYVMAALPLFLLFVFASKYYIEGLVSSGLKL